MEITQKRGYGALVWLVQAVSGVLLIVVLALHMIANHFVVPGGLQTYADVVGYLANPLVVAIETLFLVTVTSHAMLGVRAIILDTGLSRRGERAVTWFVALFGLAIVIYGLWLTSAIINSQ